MNQRSLQRQARALGDPTRHRIFRYVADADREVDVMELTDHFGLNHNAIRQHLAKLVEAELVVEGTAASEGRPGRPRLCYTLGPTVESRWGVTGPYERLSSMLSEVIRSGDTPVEVGQRIGRRPRFGRDDADPVGSLVAEMARQGFDPVVKERGDGFDIVLRECPFATTALADPDTVCGLHLGVAHGLADSLGGLVVDELVRKDPRRARCILRCHPADDTVR
jgi:predicted ArsR family transcriptional regulator